MGHPDHAAPGGKAADGGTHGRRGVAVQAGQPVEQIDVEKRQVVTGVAHPTGVRQLRLTEQRHLAGSEHVASAAGDMHMHSEERVRRVRGAPFVARRKLHLLYCVIIAIVYGKPLV